MSPPSRKVISLTTIPSRLPYLVRTLRMLANQTLAPDKIYLNLPLQYKQRHFGSIETIPKEIRAIPNIEILRCEDWGPGTKLLPCLKREVAPDTLIATADDDVNYPNTWFEDLVAAATHSPQYAVGFRGRQLISISGEIKYWNSVLITHKRVRRPFPVDILTGTWGCLYRRDFFTDEVFDLEKLPRARWNDDIWFCGHLAKNKIGRRVIPSRGDISYSDISDTVNPLYPHSQTDTYNEEIIRYFSKDLLDLRGKHSPSFWARFQRRLTALLFLKKECLP